MTDQLLSEWDYRNDSNKAVSCQEAVLYARADVSKGYVLRLVLVCGPPCFRKGVYVYLFIVNDSQQLNGGGGHALNVGRWTNIQWTEAF